MSASPRVRRPLGPMERWYWICDRISALNVIARVRVDGPCRPADLVRATARLAAEHPLLAVTVQAGPGGPRFVASQGPISVRTVTAASDEDWQREIDAELTSSVAGGPGPLARIVQVDHGGDRHDVILTVSHVVADGTTALALLQRLVELAATDSGPRQHDALPAPEAMLPRRINRLPRLAHLAAWIVADNLALAWHRPRRLQARTPVEPNRRRSQLLHRELDAGQLAAVVAWCRHEGVTVHAGVVGALALAVAGHKRISGRVCVGSPMDFRAELTPPVTSREAGAYVATVPSYVRVGPSVPVAAAARQVSRDLRRRRRLHHHLALVSLLRAISPRSVARSARAVALIDRAGPGNVCLSNLGRLDFPAEVGAWRLSGAQFVAGISISGNLVAAVNTSHGVLQCNVTYIDQAVTAEQAVHITDRALGLLLQAAGAPGPGHRQARQFSIATKGSP
ncbi:MAG: phthiocerol/phthiodiolone dimycocerosyl transferase family protein [Dermatophilaceae bacterium]